MSRILFKKYVFLVFVSKILKSIHLVPKFFKGTFYYLKI